MVAMDIISPEKNPDWSSKIGNGIVRNHEVNANVLNTFFVDKIKNLKNYIDQELIEVPITK
jgi:hypothetical protein